MKIIVAGNNTQGLQDACLRYGAPKLYSFLNEKRWVEEWDDKLGSLMVDSGAHSWNKESITINVGMVKKKTIPPAAEFINIYYDFIRRHKHKKVVWVEFDVYGHLPKEQIDEFYERIKRLNIDGQFIRVYHPMLDNGDLSVLKEWVSQGQTYIGIGNDSTELLPKIFSITKDKVKLHGFAMTKMPLMEKYPFYSVDSTSPMSTVIFGRYTTPQMSFIERADVAEAKSIECFHGNVERLENAIIETRRTQDYMTKLWAKKGVIWHE